MYLVYASRYIIQYKKEPRVNNDFQEDVNEAFELSKKETEKQRTNNGNRRKV